MDTSIKTLIETNFAEFESDPCHGFFDWFCKDSSLLNKCHSLSAKVRMVAKHTNKFDPAETYVFFKNNCPGRGGLYDDFRICELESGKVLYTVVPKSGHSGKAEVWGVDNDFEKPIVEGTWKDVKNFFATA